MSKAIVKSNHFQSPTLFNNLFSQPAFYLPCDSPHHQTFVASELIKLKHLCLRFLPYMRICSHLNYPPPTVLLRVEEKHQISISEYILSISEKYLTLCQEEYKVVQYLKSI